MHDVINTLIRVKYAPYLKKNLISLRSINEARYRLSKNIEAFKVCGGMLLAINAKRYNEHYLLKDATSNRASLFHYLCKRSII